MAYIKNGYLIVSSDAEQLVIDDFDGGIDVKAEGDMTSTRQSTKGKTIASIQLESMYILEANIPPFSDNMARIDDFFERMKSKSFPNLTITVYERIDSKYKITTYVDGNFKTNLDYDSAVSDEAPKGKIAFFGTRKTPRYQASL